MTSKEFMLNELNIFEEKMKIAKKFKMAELTKKCEEDIQQTKNVLKDLEILDIFKHYIKKHYTGFYNYFGEELVEYRVEIVYQSDIKKIEGWLGNE